MTWFRVGGAGIPASLKNAMNAVLNKKFGTSGQNYPPNGWPDDVNLLGPLPEKTVAGAIAHTDDAADTVPVKSVICSIVPKQAGSGTPSPTNVRALSGYTGMTVSQRKKNLLKLNDGTYTYAAGNLTVTISNGIASIIGTMGSSGGRTTRLSNTFLLKAGEYIVSPTGSSFDPYVRVFINRASDNASLGYNSGSKITISADTLVYIGFSFAENGVYNVNNFSPMIEVGSSQTTYEAYNAAADISDSWSLIGAIYGGERNLTDGTLKKTYELIELKVSDMNNSENYPGWKNAGVRALGISTGYYTSWLNIGSGFSVNVNSSNDILFLPTSDYGMTQSQWVANYPDLTVQIIVPVETPTEYTNLSTYDFETLYAVNNFYSDIEGGQTQLTFRQDIALALAALQGSRSLSASLIRSSGPEERTEDPEEVSEPEENIQNTEEQEGDNDAR